MQIEIQEKISTLVVTISQEGAETLKVACRVRDIEVTDIEGNTYDLRKTLAAFRVVKSINIQPEGDSDEG